jgi:hypothetical protein
MEPEGSIPNSQELSTCSYPEPDQSSPHHPHPKSLAIGNRETSNPADEGTEVEMDRAHLEERFTRDRETGSRLEPSGQCKRGRPKRTWRRMVEEDIGKVGKTWKEI